MDRTLSSEVICTVYYSKYLFPNFSISLLSIYRHVFTVLRKSHLLYIIKSGIWRSHNLFSLPLALYNYVSHKVRFSWCLLTTVMCLFIWFYRLISKPLAAFIPCPFSLIGGHCAVFCFLLYLSFPERQVFVGGSDQFWRTVISAL